MGGHLERVASLTDFFYNPSAEALYQGVGREMKIDPQDTIVAISTPHGRGAIGVVRLSGKGAVAIIEGLFTAKGIGRPTHFVDRRVYHGEITEEGRIIDEALVCVMRGPGSYTGEDVVEVSCHGSPLVLRKVVETCIRRGARLAEPGEFTKRAFLNGKMDLTKAEAVVEIINARSERALELAFSHLKGALEKRIATLKDGLMDVVVNLEADIDFPEEEISIEPRVEMLRRLKSCLKECRGILDSYKQGRIIRDGFRVVLLGKANAGKSSIFNKLLQTDRAIVTDESGTTRDTIEEVVDIDGLSIVLVDTAGIGTETGKAAKEGVKRSYNALIIADLVIFIADLSRSWSPEDIRIAEVTSGKRSILAYNKADLMRGIDLESVPKLLSGFRSVEVSALTGEGIPTLRGMIVSECSGGVDTERLNSAILFSIRHKNAMEDCIESIESAIAAGSNGYSEELLALDVRKAIGCLDEITGGSTGDEILDRIFSKFCIGK